jgi:hypothetical protein
MEADQSDRRQDGQEIGEKMSDEMKGGQLKVGKTIKGGSFGPRVRGRS